MPDVNSVLSIKIVLFKIYCTNELFLNSYLCVKNIKVVLIIIKQNKLKELDRHNRSRGHLDAGSGVLKQPQPPADAAAALN
jgi:hypothetical protein